MIKNKIKNLDLSATLKINEISKNLEKEGKKIIYQYKVYKIFASLLQSTNQKRKIIIFHQIK